MEKKCFSLRSSDFEKSIKSLGDKKIKKLNERISQLEAMENDHKLLPDGARCAESVFGKALTRMGKKNIYVLELGDDRAMAVIMERDGKKIFGWFWGGSHEDYNKKVSNFAALSKTETTVSNASEPLIEAKIIELKAVDKKQASMNVNQVREQYSDHHRHKKTKSHLR